MDKDQIQYFQNMIGDDYIISGLIGSGDSSFTFSLVEKDNQRYVMKVPSYRLMDNPELWKESQLKSFDLVKEHTKGFSGELEVPTLIKEGNNFIIEKKLGDDLDKKEVRDTLTPKDREQLGIQLGDFASFLHENSDGIETYAEHPNISFTDCFNYLKGVLNDSERQSLQKKVDTFYNRDQSDEVKTTIHRDIHAGNILHNKDTKKFALIDFEYIKQGCIYNDFTRLGNMPDVLWTMIDRHNQTCPNKVNPEKIKLFMEQRIISRACHMMGIVKKAEKQEVKQHIAKEIERLNVSYNEHLLKNSAKNLGANTKNECDNSMT